MEGQKVQEYTVETGPNGLPVARLGKVHNLITFLRKGFEKVHYFDGKWVDDGGHEVSDDKVTDEMRAQAAELPFSPHRDLDPDVLRECEFCDQCMPSREYAKHLVDRHIRTVPKAERAAVEDTESSVPAPAPHIDATPRTAIKPE